MFIDSYASEEMGSSVGATWVVDICRSYGARGNYRVRFYKDFAPSGAQPG